MVIGTRSPRTVWKENNKEMNLDKISHSLKWGEYTTLVWGGNESGQHLKENNEEMNLDKIRVTLIEMIEENMTPCCEKEMSLDNISL